MKTEDFPLYEALGREIRARREASKLTQGELAHLVNLSRASVTNIELGRQSILVDQLYRFADALGVSPPELLSAEVSRKTETEDVLPPEVVAWINRVRKAHQ
jgi:transcriptional regulator with XRE-family HTH domain